ncbi:hypothetical protein KM043_004498 [Ampulex compressa]|nr:hypothetical protein KM043_004498 [Ampulex compressa]
MKSWITITPKLEKGLKVTNQVDSSKFRLLVNRVCQSLQTDVHSKVFSAEEKEKLMASLDLNKDDLALFLDAIIMIYTQAACNMVKPSSMDTVLRDNFKITDDKVQIFLNAWMTYGKGIIENFRQESMFPTQVKDIDWCLNLQAASSTIFKDVRPTALLGLRLTGEENTELTVEFYKNELTDLHGHLEKIQAQLDALK